MKWLVIVAISAACISSNSVVCDDGTVCPAGTTCFQHGLCVTDDQTRACAGKTEGDACTVDAVAGHCQNGACLPPVCGDGFVEIGEMCDDGNTKDLDGCSADCLSNERCGNGIVDATTHEQCDDGGNLDHDGCSSHCRIENPHWIQHTLNPGVRTAAAHAYDPRRDRIVVFGGIELMASSYDIRNDTIEWTGGDWVRVNTPTAPEARYDAGMAYDRDHDVTVMFGGFGGTYDLSDTWTWDGSAWTEIPVAGPPERYGHGMVYDPKRHVVVLFGGWNDAMGVLNDTWEWDGTAWTQVTTPAAPAKRQYPAMTFDPKAGVVVLVGGDAGGTTPLHDTWTYDGTWHDVTPSGTSPQVTHAGITYDLASQRVVLFGGFTSVPTVVTQHTWTWNGTTWTDLGAAPASGRFGPMIETSRKRAVLLGGSPNQTSSLDDTWLFASNAWTAAPNLGARQSLASVNDRARGTAIFYGGQFGATQFGDTWQLDAAGFTTRAGPPPNGRASPAIAWDETNNNAVMFGGAINTTPNGETWIWNGTSWSQRTPASPPPARSRAGIAYDGSSVVMFGGTAASFSTLADTWRWNGSTWTQLAIAGPSQREGPAMAWDPVRRQVVLFGGDDGDSLDDTWIFDGTAWTDVSVAAGFRPGKRSSATLMWNPARQRLTLIGGSGYGVEDAYEWDGMHWTLVPASDAPVTRLDHTAISSLDGGGILIYGGSTTTGVDDQRWELRWDAARVGESCEATDLDDDGLVGCADPDCWWVCAPSCPPGTSCDPAAPKCGDGACDQPRESCATCAADCGACTALCGNGTCDPGETGCPGDCP